MLSQKKKKEKKKLAKIMAPPVSNEKTEDEEPFLFFFHLPSFNKACYKLLGDRMHVRKAIHHAKEFSNTIDVFIFMADH